MKPKDKIHVNILANKIIKTLIESGCSISQQLQIIKLVKAKLDFCKTTGAKMQQIEFDFE